MRYQFFITVGLILVFSGTGSAQNRSGDTTAKHIIWFVPSEARYINGSSVGLHNVPGNYKQTINGLSLELIGSGYVLPFVFMDDARYIHKTSHKLKNNGIIIGLTLFSGQVNGISLATLLGSNYFLNGMSLAVINVTVFDANGLLLGCVTSASKLNGMQIGVYNWVEYMAGTQLGFANVSVTASKGLQVGIINFAEDHRGLQIGLWNKNAKRSLPFINWNFSRARNDALVR